MSKSLAPWLKPMSDTVLQFTLIMKLESDSLNELGSAESIQNIT